MNIKGHRFYLKTNGEEEIRKELVVIGLGCSDFGTTNLLCVDREGYLYNESICNFKCSNPEQYFKDDNNILL